MCMRRCFSAVLVKMESLHDHALRYVLTYPGVNVLVGYMRISMHFSLSCYGYGQLT